MYVYAHMYEYVQNTPKLRASTSRRHTRHHISLSRTSYIQIHSHTHSNTSICTHMLCIHIYKTHQSCTPAQHSVTRVITSRYQGLHTFKYIHIHIQIHSYTHTYVVYTYIQNTPELRASTARRQMHNHISL